MELVADLIKVLLPAALVLWAMYLTVSSFLKKELVQKELNIKAETAKTILPIRLQAYERMALFLERISPNNLLIRLSGRVDTVGGFQQLMLAEIREEFSHNLAQQVYMSDEAWLNIKNAMNEIVALINLSAKDIDPNAPSLELSKRILEVVLSKNIAPSDDALKFLKQEMRNNFM
ncbi:MULTISPECIES: hypothetical protein [unclassified Arcicella]|uniref:DUF7935 family protein n=1 Tax=unclassified Arcicella TaxID=2644986 RepID=UPI002865D972|nr:MULTISPECIES: hypothetical protein [unclassified Arcicella]MDR6562929.1 hypothetical protein [Arcicella sp. BE51]MDR6813012.1 hypothetical protein [Arcicella sp. BE140]MDR6824326.1 hypothetical protein [Arcicella sp. BE139]